MQVDKELEWNRLGLKEWADSLLETSEKCPSNILDAEPHPDDLTLAQLAKEVYTVKKSGETDEDYGKRLALPKDWCLLVTGSNSGLTNGYFGAAFVHAEWRQVVVAHRGTRPSSTGALYTDWAGVCKMKYTSCLNSAATFVELVRQAVSAVKGYSLAITGHSLGGWLGQITTLTLEHLVIRDGKFAKTSGAGILSKTVVFESPGALPMLDKILGDSHLRYTRNVSIEKLNITAYLSAPNLINTSGQHVGTIFRLMINVSEYGFLQKTIKYTLATHSIENIMKAFEERREIRQVLNWPVNNEEYKFFHTNVDHGSGYHLELKEVEYSESVKYRTETNKNRTRCLRHFSEQEINFLDFWSIFKKSNIRLNVMNEFLEQKKLGGASNLLPLFMLDHSNQNVTCESKEDLDQLTRRVKQLLRYYPSFMDALKRQSALVPLAVDLAFKLEGDSYLDKLATSYLDFTDAMGLRDFLHSDSQRVLCIVTRDGDFEMARLRNVFCQISRQWRVLEDPRDKRPQTFLDWPRVQKINSIYEKAIEQDNIMFIDVTTSVDAYGSGGKSLVEFVKSNDSGDKKLVLILSESIDLTIQNAKIIEFNKSIDFMDLTEESQRKLLGRDIISSGNRQLSMRQFVGESFDLCSINQLIHADDFKKLVTDDECVIRIKETRPELVDIQMPFFQVRIKANTASIKRLARSPDNLVVVSGSSHLQQLQLGRQDIILAEGDGVQVFKDTCKKNGDKVIYLLDVSGADVQCKQIFNGAFQLNRNFHHRASVDLRKFAQTKQPDDLFVTCSENDKSSLLRFIENCAEKEALAQNVLIATSKQKENAIIQKYAQKNIHFVKIDESREIPLEWRYSHGSVENLRYYVSTELCEPIDQQTLSQTERNIVILADEPGMGKTTSLASLSMLMGSAWVIHIELRKFQVHIDKLSEELTAKDVVNFLLSECCTSADGRLVHGLLEHLLQSKTCSKRLVLIMDGFDEVEDYRKKKSAKEKLIKLLLFLQSKPTVQIFLSTRKYLEGSLEKELNQFSTSFKVIKKQEQVKFLVLFWRSCLSLELEDYGEEEERRLEAYAGELLREAKRVLGPDINCFMGVPLQLRMLAEVFRPKSELLARSPGDLNEQINIRSAQNLYKMFVNLKFKIYYYDKTRKNETSDDLDERDYFNKLTKKHSELGFRTFFSEFYCEHNDTLEDDQLIKLNRVGLVQSRGNGEFQFVHRTYAEYCCAQRVVYWLKQRGKRITDPLFEEILLPQILLQPERKTIRMFLNVELEETQLSEHARKLNAECISRLWIQNRAIFKDQEDQTAVHIAVREGNPHILTLLLCGLNGASTQETFVSFITQCDVYNNTALNIVDKRLFESKDSDDSNDFDDRIMNTKCIGELKLIVEIIIRSTETCSDALKERVILASLLNRDLSKSYVADYLQKQNETLKTFESAKKMLSEIANPFIDAIARNDVGDIEILCKHLNNNERYYFLIVNHLTSNETVLHFAVQHSDVQVVKTLVEQTTAPFHVLMRQLDSDGRNPLESAAHSGLLDIVKCFMERAADMHSRVWGQSAMTSAMMGGHLPVIEYLVERGVQTNCVDEFGYSALHLAASTKNLPVVEYLLQNGEDINCMGTWGRSALHMTVEKGHLPVLEYLLQNSADINSINEGGQSALHVAAEKGHFPVLEYLLQNGADINCKDRWGQSALHVVAEKGHFPIIEYLIQNGADINCIDKDGQSALHMAAGAGHLPIIEYLLQNSADINCIDNVGRSAVHVATGAGHLPVLEYLLRNGADINSMDIWGRSALHMAAEKGHLLVLDCLLQNGADINCIDEGGQLALHMAAKAEHLPVLEYLLQYGADINCKGIYGKSALHEAAEAGHFPVIEYLIQNGADINCIDEGGQSALFVAARAGNILVIEYLLQNGADINCVDICGLSALHAAVEKYELHMVEYLLEKGVDPNRRNGQGHTALNIASRDKRWDMVQLLVEQGADVHADGGKALSRAIELEEWTAVEYLLGKGVSIPEIDYTISLSEESHI